MCMRNRISTFGKQGAIALSLLAACGLTWSCKDDYTWDDEKPTWLNSSIYESLQERANFNTYLRLLEDKDVNIEGVRNLKDVLSKTGSKTVFVANDQAWEEFFKANAIDADKAVKHRTGGKHVNGLCSPRAPDF